MTTPSLQDLRAQLDSIDTCLRKYVRLRAQLIEVISFMEDEKEQEHLRMVRERSRPSVSVPEPEPEVSTSAQEPARIVNGHFRPRPVAPVSEVQKPLPVNPLATTLSMDA